MSKSAIKHQNFFVIRTPRMPISELKALGTNPEQTQIALKSWIAIPQVKEALYLASPSLIERIETFENNTTNNSDQNPKKSERKQAKKLQLALLKYMIRMCSRATPFGLFSGISMGVVGSQTKLLSSNLSLDSRKTRLDFFYLSALKEHFLKHNIRSEQLKYYPNPSHYSIAEHCRYIEAYQSENSRQYRLSAIERNDYFDYILMEAKKGLSFHQLVKALLQRFSENELTDGEQLEADNNDVIDYVQQLIDESILVADIPLPLTGDAPDSALINSLNQIGQRETADHLSTTLYQLQKLDRQRLGAVDDYKKILKHLNELPVKTQENKLFQADVYRAFETCELGQNSLEKLTKQLKLIQSLSIKNSEPFNDFINKFNLRFEGQFVPLDKLLDEESGISFSNETGYEAPLLAGLQLNNRATNRGRAKQISILDGVISQELSLPENRTKPVIQLNSKALEKQLDKSISESELPASFAVSISLYENKKTHDLLIKFNGSYGPSAANLLGRFCHLSEALHENIKEHLTAESRHSPDVIFAEVVHTPEGRPGNVIARPHLRQYEIVFLADSSLPSEYQIPISDLHVWVEAGQVKLWSKRLNKQIIPRLSTAHVYSNNSLSPYKFLGLLQRQGSSLPKFSMPDSLSSSSFVPRIMLDDLILSEKIWRVPRSELEGLLDTKILEATKLECKKWRDLKEKYQIDDHVAYAMSDNVLQLNLTNPLMLEILLAETKGQNIVELKEVLNVEFDTPVKSSNGQSYANELIIPLFNNAAKVHTTLNEDPQAHIVAETIQRRFSPGSQWLSLKIYSGNTAVETLLTEQLSLLIEQCASLYEKWFFIRYGDPNWHLRLRFLGQPSILYGKLLPKLNQLLEPMVESGEIHKTELFTYEREVERYGGPKAMALSEELFMADSQLVVKAMQLECEYGENIRWRIVLLMTDQLLNAFGYNTADKLRLINELRIGFGHEFNDTSKLRKQLGDNYKKIQTQLVADFSQKKNQDRAVLSEESKQVFELIDNWSKNIKPTVISFNTLFSSNEGITCKKDTLLKSFLHMHNNRMFKAYGREHEMVMHDFLRRYYFSAGKRS